ncbi:zonular occludens toxin domain-containing protein [Microcoleus sp. B5-D4]|uniref:zonular occludens toxin domain-containing protein n=1 Tax=unclassified Microcoleus TaxID=2642155 RepID=UPI002FD59C03
MPFTAIYGLPGRGKSLLMLQHGLRIAEKYKLRLVTNFNLDPLCLAYYCKINNLKWLWENIPKGIIYYVSSNKNFAQFLQIQRAVILLDEMGLYAPSAQSWTLPPEAFNAVANNRKMCQHIVYAAQYPTQVHSSLHQICSEILYAEGTTVWSEELENERLLFKDCHLFMPSEFEVWFRDPKVRKNPVKVWVLATKHWKGIISALDAHTFRIYDSFGLLEKQDDKVSLDKTFGYQPYIIDSACSLELSAQDLLDEGHTFDEIEQKLDQYYKADRFKKKRIYEASNNYPFVAWKLVGNIPFSGPHIFQKMLLPFWDMLPAASYPGLKKLDLRITRECLIWDKLDKQTKDGYKIMWRVFLGIIFWFISSLMTNIFLPRNSVIAFVCFAGSFYLPFQMFK